MKAEQPTWMYSNNGPRLFKEGEDIPEGFEDSPAKVNVAPSSPCETPVVRRQRRPRAAKE